MFVGDGATFTFEVWPKGNYPSELRATVVVPCYLRDQGCSGLVRLPELRVGSFAGDTCDYIPEHFFLDHPDIAATCSSCGIINPFDKKELESRITNASLHFALEYLSGRQVSLVG